MALCRTHPEKEDKEQHNEESAGLELTGNREHGHEKDRNERHSESGENLEQD